jgi:hypothetical protein
MEEKKANKSGRKTSCHDIRLSIDCHRKRFQNAMKVKQNDRVIQQIA